MQRSQDFSSRTDAKRKVRREVPKPLSVTVDDACQLSGLGRTLLYDLIREGRLQSATIGRRRLVIFASLEALIGTSKP
jgi:excisionase family DNA binding protein